MKQYRGLILALLAVLGCSLAFAASYNRVPGATFATADATCGTQTGNTCWVTDCLTNACSAGAGTIQMMMIRNEAGVWVPAPMTSIEVPAIFCGDLGNNTTVFTSPATGYPGGVAYNMVVGGVDYRLAGTGCAAEDSTTEATADEIMFTQTAAKVNGLYCQVNSSGSNGVVFHVRTAAGPTTPDITCTIPTGSTECTSYISTTTNIAANAAVDVDAITTENLSASDFWCFVQFALQ